MPVSQDLINLFLEKVYKGQWRATQPRYGCSIHLVTLDKDTRFLRNKNTTIAQEMCHERHQAFPAADCLQVSITNPLIVTRRFCGESLDDNRRFISSGALKHCFRQSTDNIEEYLILSFENLEIQHPELWEQVPYRKCCCWVKRVENLPELLVHHLIRYDRVDDYDVFMTEINHTM